MTKRKPRETCTFLLSVTSCSGTQCPDNNEWYWQLTGTNTQPLSQSHVDAINLKMYVRSGSNTCIAFVRVSGGNFIWKDIGCNDNTKKIICEFDGKGLSPTGKEPFKYEVRDN